MLTAILMEMESSTHHRMDHRSTTIASWKIVITIRTMLKNCKYFSILSMIYSLWNFSNKAIRIPKNALTLHIQRLDTFNEVKFCNTGSCFAHFFPMSQIRSLGNSFVRFNYSKLKMIILGIGKREDIFEEEKNYWVNERNVPSNLKTCQSATEILIVGFSERNFFS